VIGILLRRDSQGQISGGRPLSTPDCVFGLRERPDPLEREGVKEIYLLPIRGRFKPLGLSARPLFRSGTCCHTLNRRQRAGALPPSRRTAHIGPPILADSFRQQSRQWPRRPPTPFCASSAAILQRFAAAAGCYRHCHMTGRRKVASNNRKPAKTCTPGGRHKAARGNLTAGRQSQHGRPDSSRRPPGTHTSCGSSGEDCVFGS